MTAALITGASGFIAPYVARVVGKSLAERIVGADIRAVAGAPYTEVHVADLTEAVSTRDAVKLASPDFVFHLVGLVRGSEEAVFASNVTTTQNLLLALRDFAPAARVVLVGSAAEYGAVPVEHQPVHETFVGSPTVPYGQAKRRVTELAVEAVRDFGLQVSVARPFNVIGPGVPDALVGGAIIHRLRAAIAGPAPRSIAIGRTTAVRDFVAVEDVAIGLVRIAERGQPGDAYNLCSGEGHSISELLQRLLGLAGTPITVSQDESLVRARDVDVIIGSNGKARNDLGWQPTISFEDSLMSAWRNV